MNTHSIPQPSATTYSVFDLVTLAQSGRIRVPEFQRPLRWGWEDARRLFDSIARGYPIGSLLLWKRPARADTLHLGALRIDAPELGDALWVVDGQQRLTSLASALSDAGQRDDRFALAYDLRTRAFVRRDPSEPHVVPLPDLFDLQRVLRWLRNHPELTDYAEDAARITTTLREYKIPAYIVEQEEEEVLRDIFDRMNNYGKRLSRAEIFAALHPAESPPGEASFARIIDVVDSDLGFGRLDDDTVLRALLARRGGDVTRDIRNEFSAETRSNRDFGDETQEAAYREGGAALERAVRFLVECGVPHVAFLPYRYLLVVLTRFFAHFPEPLPRNRELLARWFWRAALVGPGAFSGSYTQTMRSLASRIRPHREDDSVAELLEMPGNTAPRAPNLERFKTNQADSRVALCALWALEPRSPRTGDTYSRQELALALNGEATAQTVLRRFVPRPPQHMSTWLANRVLVLEEAPLPPLDAFSPELLGESHGGSLPLERQREVLASHGLDEQQQTRLAQRENEAFLMHRQDAVRAIVDAFVRRRTAQEFEDTPPLESLVLDDEDEDEDEPQD